MFYDLTVVIPCFNEEQNIRLGALDKIVRYLEKHKKTWEVIIVDDGSTDGSQELIKNFISSNGHFRLIINPHQGKAQTIVSGMLEAKGKYVLFTDLDQATPIDQIEKLLPWFGKGYEIVIGSRKEKRIGAPWLRRLMGPGFMLVRHLILGMGKLNDTQCGFKMFKNEVAKDIFKRLKVYRNEKQVSGPRVTAGFDVEVLYIGIKQGNMIKEVPVEWHYVDTRRVSPFMDSWDALMDIFRIKVNSLKGLYDSQA